MCGEGGDVYTIQWLGTGAAVIRLLSRLGITRVEAALPALYSDSAGRTGPSRHHIPPHAIHVSRFMRTLDDRRPMHGHQVRQPLGAAQELHPGVEHERHGCWRVVV